MVDLARLFRSYRNVSPSEPADGRITDESSIKVVAMTRDRSTWEQLRHIADRFNWILLWAMTHDQAIYLTARYAATVLIYDRDLAEYDWRTEIRRLSASRLPPQVLLASNVSGPYLWKEVVRHGGFDVIAKPFEAERVTRAIRCAWLKQSAASKQSVRSGDSLSDTAVAAAGAAR